MVFRMKKSKLWIVDDEESIREICRSALEDNFIIETFPNGSEALLALNSDEPDLIITDIKMPGLSGLDLLQKVSEKCPSLPTIVITAHSDIDNALSAYKGGAFEYLPKPFDVDTIRSLALKALNQTDVDTIQKNSNSTAQSSKIIGQAQSLQNVFRAIGKISNSNITVLIRGESGTGKELIAQAVHNNSNRSSKPFVAINVAAIPHDLLESELFGHEKGAFTGANSSRKGYFEVADGGTIFLDEVGELPLTTQVRLLRVLENGEFIKVGSYEVHKTNVRIVAATNLNMDSAIQKGKFREDLFYRLSTVEIKVPPLRDRKEDIHLLFRKFASDFAKKYNMPTIRLDENAQKLLTMYSWNGNVRQLRNVAEQLSVLEEKRNVSVSLLKSYLPELSSNLPAVINKNKDSSDFSNEREILYKILFYMKKDLNDLKKITKHLNSEESSIDYKSEEKNTLEKLYNNSSNSSDLIEINKKKVDFKSHEVNDDKYHFAEEISEEETLSIHDKELELIIKALERNGGKRKAAAKELGISERTLYRKIKQHDIEL